MAKGEEIDQADVVLITYELLSNLQEKKEENKLFIRKTSAGRFASRTTTGQYSASPCL